MKAFLIVGPESSGTRMVTDALIRAGVFGQPGHTQELDNLDFSGRPDLIVLRRSVPHGDLWPDLSRVIRSMTEAGYAVSPIVTYRDKDYCVRSQLRAGHKATESEARTSYYWAYKHIFKHLAACGLFPVVCHYTSFVNNVEFRTLFFAQLGLPCPELELFDANLQYPRRVRQFDRRVQCVDRLVQCSGRMARRLGRGNSAVAVSSLQIVAGVAQVAVYQTTTAGWTFHLSFCSFWHDPAEVMIALTGYGSELDRPCSLAAGFVRSWSNRSTRRFCWRTWIRRADAQR
jgi:hypothetical protein